MATNASRTRVRFSIDLTTIGILGVALLALAAPATAATCTWTGAGGDALWSHSTNWSGCTAPANGDVLIFPAGAPAVSTNDLASLTILRISITGVAQGASYRIGGLGITVSDQLTSSGGIGPDGRLSTLALPIRLDAGNSVIVNVTQNGYLAITGVITEAGPASVVKQGFGTVALDNPANAWSRLAIEDGFVQQQVAGAIPATLRVEMSSATAFLLLNNIDTTIRELRTPHFPPTSSSFGQITIGSRTLTITGDCDFSGQIFGSHIVKTGPGTAIFDSPFQQFYTGTITVNEGTLTLMKSQSPPSVVGAVVVNGGVFHAGQSGVLPPTAAVTVNSPGVFALDTLADTTVGSLTGDGSVTLAAARLSVGGDNSSPTFAGVISGTGSPAGRVALTKVGIGTLTLTGNHSFDGYTRINEGTLIVNGSMPTGANSDIEVFGGTFGGTGTVGAIFMPSAGPKVSPGTSPGILHARSAVLHGTYVVELNGFLPGSGYDQLLVSEGDVDITNATLQVSRGFAPHLGAQFSIITFPDTSSGRVIGTFAGLPEGAELLLGAQRFRISYDRTTRGVSLLSIDFPPVLTIDDVTVMEGESGSTDAVFTVSLSRPLDEAITVQYTTGNGTGTAPGDYAGTSGSLVFLPGMTTRTIIVPVFGDDDVEPDETFLVKLFGLAGAGGRELAAFGRSQGIGTIATDDVTRTYYLSEGATGAFFDEDILIANPNDTIAPVTLTFLEENGTQVVATRTIGPRSHVTVHADLVPGLEATTASVKVTSEAGVPLIVERTMFWDRNYYAGHTGSAVDQPSPDWLFAEGSQGFFDTFVLVANPQATATDVTFTFLTEGGAAPVVVTRTLAPTSRLTLYAGDVPELLNRSFGVTVHASQPIMAERAMYFGSTPARLWSGGTESAGVTSAATHWFLAEGATGGFFDTFVLLSNPQSTAANVTVTYLLDAGPPVSVPKVVPANGRLTINLETEDDLRLHNAAVSTVVNADQPIVAERSMYWSTPWHEAHNSFGVVDLGTRWGLAEGRVGGALNFHTYILLANPQTTAATVTVTYLREEGAPLVRQYTVPPTSRFNIDVNAIVPEMHDESFGTLVEVTNGVAIAAERSMYWDAQGLFWSGGANATGTRLP